MLMPFSLIRNLCPDCIPLGIDTLTIFFSIVGTSILPPSAAVVKGIATSQIMLSLSL